ncbi:hypothetical protein A3752_18880 [Oleiphilus sp. HI0081]|uniref:hypothetical protein n=1 Tax=unclassified Oleiphilus TaxID=2631174 RepID=UPI0007C2655D|nr:MULTISPECIES: hypothetical protein [unclassified Oleiphilus]KZZ20293.1 hypothetical protein A3749_19475 [Oleiphilus sp. HI0078]KZZ29514.1 hypothetical protein A3752_18880 [Oleiphilus sp. HI0081]KZY34358.1 hypothetical protein A3729_18335 [Oleiphilus sp. HI0043]KZY36185.1 hypothetical protein A3729_30170 [Oleiphilus sp. HI0043]KZY57838.1 hypothetical protein A3735_18320 [Oleiphilus sp. HI0061]
MDSDVEILIAIFLVVALFIWLIPALIYTIKISRLKRIDPVLKKQLISSLWFMPPVGCIICLVLFSKTGKLRKLLEQEHHQVWVAGGNR